MLKNIMTVDGEPARQDWFLKDFELASKNGLWQPPTTQLDEDNLVFQRQIQGLSDNQLHTLEWQLWVEKKKRGIPLE
jgi:hypothetical protein